MKQIRLLALAFSALILASCGKIPEPASIVKGAVKSPEATPYYNYINDEGVSVSNRDNTSVTILNSEDQDTITEIGNFEFSNDDLEFFKSLPQQELYSFRVEYQLPVIDTMEELAELLKPYSKTDDHFNCLTENINEIKEDNTHAVSEDWIKEALKEAEIFSEMGCKTLIKKDESVENGKTFLMFLCVVVCTPEEMLNMGNLSEYPIRIYKQSNQVDLRFNDVVWESKDEG